MKRIRIPPTPPIYHTMQMHSIKRELSVKEKPQKELNQNQHTRKQKSVAHRRARVIVSATQSNQEMLVRCTVRLCTSPNPTNRRPSYLSHYSLYIVSYLPRSVRSYRTLVIDFYFIYFMFKNLFLPYLLEIS